MLGYPPTPPPPPLSPRRLTALPTNHLGLGRGGGGGGWGGGGGGGFPYNPRNGCTSFGVTHWPAAAPMARC